MSVKMKSAGSFDRGTWAKRLLSLAALVALWLFALWAAIKPGYSFAIFQDNEYIFAPIFSFMSEALHKGSWPLWINTIMGGVPLYDNPQFSPWYPFYFMYLPFYQDAASAIHQTHWINLLHIFILELNTYILLRTVPVSRLGALLGAAVLAFSANMYSYAGWVNIVAPYAWLPLYVAALIAVFRDDCRYSKLIMGILSMVLLVFASPSQALIHALFITTVYVIYTGVLRARRGEISLFLRGFARLAIIGLVSMLVTAPLLLPAIAHKGEMIRWLGALHVIGNEKIPFDAFLTDQLSLTSLGGVLVGISRSRILGNEYVGLIVFGLAAMAILSRRLQHLVFPLAIMAVYALFSSAGANLGFAYLNYMIPFLNLIHEPSRFLFVFVLATAVLAGIGLDHLRERAGTADVPLFGKREWVVVAVVTGLWLAAALTNHDNLVSKFDTYAPIALWCALLALGAVLGRPGGKIYVRDGIAISFAVMALGLNFHYVKWVPPSIDNSDYVTAENEHLRAVMQQLAQLDPTQDYRVLIEGDLNKQHAAMIGSFYGVRTFNAYMNPLPHVEFSQLYYQGPRQDNYFRLLGGKYLICRACTPASVKGYALKEDVDGISIYETSDVAPHYYAKSAIDGYYKDWADFVGSAAEKSAHDGVLFVRSADHDALQTLPAKPFAGGVCAIKGGARALNLFTFSLDCQAPQMVVLNEYDGGQWKASLNGVDVPVFEVNGNQVGVLVSSGSGSLQIRYAPTTFYIGLWLSAAGGALFLAVVLCGLFAPWLVFADGSGRSTGMNLLRGSTRAVSNPSSSAR